MKISGDRVITIKMRAFQAFMLYQELERLLGPRAIESALEELKAETAAGQKRRHLRELLLAFWAYLDEPAPE